MLKLTLALAAFLAPHAQAAEAFIKNDPLPFFAVARVNMENSKKEKQTYEQNGGLSWKMTGWEIENHMGGGFTIFGIPKAMPSQPPTKEKYGPDEVEGSIRILTGNTVDFNGNTYKAKIQFNADRSAVQFVISGEDLIADVKKDIAKMLKGELPDGGVDNSAKELFELLKTMPMSLQVKMMMDDIVCRSNKKILTCIRGSGTHINGAMTGDDAKRAEEFTKKVKALEAKMEAEKKAKEKELEKKAKEAPKTISGSGDESFARDEDATQAI